MPAIRGMALHREISCEAHQFMKYLREIVVPIDLASSADGMAALLASVFLSRGGHGVAHAEISARAGRQKLTKIC